MGLALGASGSAFYISDDDNFILKSASTKEVDFMLASLQDYCHTTQADQRTLLPKFFALIQYTSVAESSQPFFGIRLSVPR